MSVLSDLKDKASRNGTTLGIFIRVAQYEHELLLRAAELVARHLDLKFRTQEFFGSSATCGVLVWISYDSLGSGVYYGSYAEIADRVVDIRVP